MFIDPVLFQIIGTDKIEIGHEMNLIRALLVTFFIIGMSTSAQSEQRDEGLVASTLHYPPYEYMENGVAKGIAVDLIREAFRRVGEEKVTFQFYPWKRAVYLTQHGHSDVLFNAGKNKARQEWGLYTDSVLIQQSYVLFKRADDDLSVSPDFSDSADKSIAVRRGYLYGSGSFRQALDSEKFSAVTLSDSTEQSVSQLLNGRVDLFVGDLLPVLYYLKQEGLEKEVDIVMDNGDAMEVLSWPTYLLFSKQRSSNEFVQRVSSAMDEMKADGTFQGISERYTQ